MSNRLAPTAISSMPQQAVANGIGQRLYLRHQLITESRLVTTVFSGTSTPPTVLGGFAALVTIGRGAPSAAEGEAAGFGSSAIRTPPCATRRRMPPSARR